MSQVHKTIIVDDEPAARRLMNTLLLDHSEVIQIIGEAGNGKDAIAMIDTLQPDLIFLDIQMPDMTGFEVIEQLQHRPNIIFTTAYEQYAIKAFETFSIDYLLKPIREDRLAQSLAKLGQFGKVKEDVNIAELKDIIQQLKVPQKATAFPIRTGDRIILLKYEQITYLEAQDKYVYIYTLDGGKHLTDHSLTALTEKLPTNFYRIQKSFIINKEKIREIHRHFNGRYLFVMDDKNGTRLTSGRTYHEGIRNEFGL